ncbi:hypothetical protein SCA6_010312 [Theobroma cacao]
MATTLANRAATNQTIGLSRLVSNFFRNLSTASSTQNPRASSSSSAASKKPKRKKKKNLFEVAQFLPNWGLGYHMAKTHWTDVSYQITKINLYKFLGFRVLGFTRFEFVYRMEGMARHGELFTNTRVAISPYLTRLGIGRRDVGPETATGYYSLSWKQFSKD